MAQRITTFGAIVSAVIAGIILLFAAGNWFTGYGELKSDVQTIKLDLQELKLESNSNFEILRDEIRISQEEIVQTVSRHEHNSETGGVVYNGLPPNP